MDDPHGHFEDTIHRVVVIDPSAHPDPDGNVTAVPTPHPGDGWSSVLVGPRESTHERPRWRDAVGQPPQDLVGVRFDPPCDRTPERLSSDGLYRQYELIAVPVDGQWRLQDVVRLEDENGGPVTCTTEHVRAGLTPRWEAYVTAFDRFWQDPTAADAAAQLNALTVLDFAPLDTMVLSVQREDVHRDLVFDRVDRKSATLSWCEDPALDPDGVAIDESGEESSLPPTAVVSRWVFKDGEWLVEEVRLTRGSYGESPDLAPTFMRCFA